MKKLTVFFVIFVVGLSGFAQKTHRVMGWKITRDIPQNEIKINLPTTIFLSYPEIAYERILSTDISLGAALGVALQKDRYPVNFAFNPYFRWFFGGNSKSMDKYGAGFFIEANGALLSSNYNYNNPPYTYTDNNGNQIQVGGDVEDDNFGAGLGLAIGWKYLSKNNWVGEVYLGGGRDFVNDGAYPRMGISIGKRF